MFIPFTDINYFVLSRWTQAELKMVFAMLQTPEFDVKDIDPDLHNRTDKADLGSSGWPHHVLQHKG
jgi:hypothetical protein